MRNRFLRNDAQRDTEKQNVFRISEIIPNAAVCTTTYNCGPYIEKFIESFRRAGIKNFVVSDNFSIDNTEDILLPLNVIYVKISSSIGEGRNQAILRNEKKWTIVADPDNEYDITQIMNFSIDPRWIYIFQDPVQRSVWIAIGQTSLFFKYKFINKSVLEDVVFFANSPVRYRYVNIGNDLKRGNTLWENRERERVFDLVIGGIVRSARCLGLGAKFGGLLKLALRKGPKSFIDIPLVFCGFIARTIGI